MEGVLGSLGINLSLFIAQLVNVGIVFFVMWRWVYRPLVKMMDERSQKISTGLSNAQEAERQLKDAVAEKDRMVQDAKKEAHRLMEEVTAKAETVRHEKLAQAKTEIEKIVVEAKAGIAAEKQAAFDALKNDIADLVAAATTKVVGNIDEKGQRALIAAALDDVKNA